MTFKISLGLDLDHDEKLQKNFNIIDKTNVIIVLSVSLFFYTLF